MNESEIKRIEAEAAADEVEAMKQEPGALGAVQPVGMVEEFADFLDMAAKIAGVGFGLPSIPARFSRQANESIAAAAIKLCEKYGIDAREILIGNDSTLGAWLAFALAAGLPSYAVYQDFRVKKAQEVKSAENQAAEHGDDKQSGK